MKAFNAGRPAQALKLFRRARAAGDRSPALRTFIAHALRATGPEGRIEELRLRGQEALSAGDPAAAAVLLKKGLALARSSAKKKKELLDVLRSCALAHQFAGRLTAAEELYRFLLKAAPGDAASALALAGVMRARQKPAEEKALLARALRRDRGELAAADRFRALMKGGRRREAIAAAERILDRGATLNDIRVFWDPWEWDDRRPRADRLAELAALEDALGPKPRTPWLHYYRAELLGPGGEDHFEPIAGFPRERYGWMFSKAGLSALCAGRFERAVEWFKIALASKPVDWRTAGFLAEALLCLGRRKEAWAALAKMQSLAKGADAGQALAWRGAVDLWLGRYQDALEKLDEAARLDAQCAFCWRAAALLKLGRPEEALAGLDETLRRFPRDFEAYVWRGEAKRALGRYEDALKDLNEEAYDDPNREPPIWLWALINRALVKGALGDRAGLEADFKAVPAYVTDYIRAKTGLEDPEKILRAGLELSRGFRREEYRQAIWMT